MGFMDKAKKMAEQAQTKLDEAQKQFNQPSGGDPAAGGGPAVEYDAHGRPIPSSSAPQSDPAPPSAPPAPPTGDSGVEEDRNRPSYAPPKLSSGDPLSG